LVVHFFLSPPRHKDAKSLPELSLACLGVLVVHFFLPPPRHKDAKSLPELSLACLGVLVSWWFKMFWAVLVYNLPGIISPIGGIRCKRKSLP
jgi:hypothetical protein